MNRLYRACIALLLCGIAIKTSAANNTDVVLIITIVFITVIAGTWEDK